MLSATRGQRAAGRWRAGFDLLMAPATFAEAGERETAVSLLRESEQADRYAALVGALGKLGSVAVAYSGGADSALVAAAAREALGGRAVAVTGVSATLPERERAGAAATAAAIGIHHVELPLDELGSPEFVANTAERCYHCKRLRLQGILGWARAHGFTRVADGANADDAGDWRPGLRAGGELGIRSPLLELGIGKEAVRGMLRQLGLAVHNKPSSPCLSSRIPYGSPVTAETLRQVELAEELLLALGLKQVRVRHHGAVARIEVPPEEFARVLAAEGLSERIRALGFQHVALDLEGFRSGNLNRALGTMAGGPLAVVPNAVGAGHSVPSEERGP